MELVEFAEAGGYELIEGLVAAANWEEIRHVIDRVRVVFYNTARQAIQVEDCDGHVIAHYPVTTSGQAALE